MSSSTSIDSLSSHLASLGLQSVAINTLASVSHKPATSPATWREELQASSSTPSGFELTKTLIFKPRAKAAAQASGTSTAAAPEAVVVIARETTDTSTASSLLAKKFGFKDLRLASADLLQEVFGLDKDSLSPLAITPSTYPRVITVLDTSLASSNAGSIPFALHANSSTSTLFVSASDIVTYLRAVESANDASETKINEVDFSNPGAAAVEKESKPAKEKEDAKIAGAVQIAIGVKKEVDFATWYTNVLLKADMLDYYSVSGCYILKPWSYSIWEVIQRWFDTQIKEIGVENSYFPMFVSAKVLEREKDHIEGFSPEVAWVTKAGSSDLEEPIAIRPTSETAMYPYYAKWIKSHRDLPLKLNQWNNVVRWEFKNPQPFLRTREFLWQEGHTAHLTKKEADAEVLHILGLYQQVYEHLLAVPVIPGVKSEKEKFAGGLYTTTVEGFIPTSGRGIQGGTSHCLGQNFSRPEMFNIVVEDPDDPTGKKKLYVWQNSWGLSTRVIGVMVMVHGDNQGLVLPPRVANLQVVVVPCGITARTSQEERSRIYGECQKLVDVLKAPAVGIRAKADLRDGYTPGYKFNDWEQKGVPLRLELGPGDLAKSQTLSVRRDTGVKAPLALSNLAETVPKLLDTIQSEMYTRAKEEFDSHIVVTTDWKDVVPALDAKNIVVLPWCEVEKCEDDIKERSGRASEPQDERAPSAGAKSLCIPFDQSKWPKIEPGVTKCPQCGSDAKRWTLFGRSY